MMYSSFSVNNCARRLCRSDTRYITERDETMPWNMLPWPTTTITQLPGWTDRVRSMRLTAAGEQGTADDEGEPHTSA